MSIAGLTVARALIPDPKPNANDDVYEMIKRVPIGDPANNNDGITWFGSQFTGPGNRVITDDGKYAANSLPRLPNDWVTLEHDVDYHNATNTSKDNIWELDKKAILSSLRTTDPYGGNIATAVGLVAKNIVERTHEAITGSSQAIYPKKSTSHVHIPWFDRHSTFNRRRYCTR